MVAVRVEGFRAGGIWAGIKKRGKKDLALILSDRECTACGVFTQNTVKAAPVEFDLKRITRGVSRGIVINSGCANACTGKEGLEDTKLVVRAAERAAGVPAGSLLVASTGVIGERLPANRIVDALPRLVSKLSAHGWLDCAEAIMTTDTHPKLLHTSIELSEGKVNMVGVAKGAGMIEPSMATMLAFVLTDADIGRAPLERALRKAVDGSFNAITVDGEMSTNDTVIALANGASGVRIRKNTDDYRLFSELLSEVATELATMIVRDGEGATKFVEVELKGAKTLEEARRGAKKVANSLLVKTALFGEDPNWGRIMATLGAAGIRFDPEKVAIDVCGIRIVEGGLATGRDRERQAKRRLKRKEIDISIDLKAGSSSTKVWTTDLSYDYVKINASYRS